jgi:carboxyl-terminal processing protease
MLAFLSVGYGLSSRATPREISRSDSAEPNSTQAATADAAEKGAVDAACELIYEGKFDAARELIEQSDEQTDPRLAQLAEIVQEYEEIGERREEARQAAYKEQLAELDKYRNATDNSDVNDVNSVKPLPEIPDVNDANDVSTVLSVIAQASQYADEGQKKELLSDPFVEEAIQKAIDIAAAFEMQGKWLEAYTNCYFWLAERIDPNNKAYSEYAEQLLEKAGIVASFQDSPCETRRQRYKGVERRMFVRAMDVLAGHYVSSIDYSQMAVKGIRRCELLAEVMAAPTFTESLYETNAENSESSFVPPDANELTAWSAGLAALLADVKDSPTGLNRDKLLDIFDKVLDLNETTAELPRAALIAQFAEAALSALDPYTVMIWPQQVQSFEKTMTNEFTGIGIEISKPRGRLTVSSLLPGTPAYKSGLDAGDVITTVDGLKTEDMSLMCAVRKITGPAGTDVKLTIKRPGQEKAKEISITRAKIVVPTIRGWKRTEAGRWLYMLDEQNKVGYIRLTSFSGETAADMEEVLEKLEEQGLQGLILDLRFNSGGLLNSAIDVADKFIEEGRIVTTRSPHAVWTYADAHKKNTHPNYPMAVLINSYAASASEIVAGALADPKYERAVLVGARTHGKGSVQGITHYPGGGARLKYTMAHYHLPSDQRVKSQDEVQKQGGTDWGIGPDINIELRSDERSEMLSVQRENDVLVQADRDPNNGPLNKHTIKESLAADPQLAVGLLAVKTKMIERGNRVSVMQRFFGPEVCDIGEVGRHRPI